MENQSKQELLSTLSKQNDQIKRYEDRLRDMVNAYKNIAKQKETLEASLHKIQYESGGNISSTTSTSLQDGDKLCDTSESLKEKYEKMLKEMREEMKSMADRYKVEISNLKAKLVYEKQERERDHINNAAMIKEMNTKLGNERKNKDKHDEKSHDTHVSTQEMEKRIRDLHRELEATQRKLNRAEARTQETPQTLVRLHEKIALLQQSHNLALREEQIKAKRAEESARRMCSSQEERIAMLEAKLAELSHTVGEYDRWRQRDQTLIQKLRNSLNTQILIGADTVTDDNKLNRSETDNEKLADTEYLKNLIDKIHLLKTEFISENEKLGSPVDIRTMFVESTENVHEKCRTELQCLKNEYDAYKRMHSTSQQQGHNLKYKGEIEKLKAEIEYLNDKMETMSYEHEEKRREYEQKLLKKDELLENERYTHRESNSELRSRVLTLEKQLHTQRDKYAALLDENEHYIRARSDRLSASYDHKELIVTQEISGPPHMLHYTQELARKDLDITQLRRDKHQLEGQLRDCQRDATIQKEHFKENIKTLKEEIDRMRRSQSREGANLEYLKNVVLSYISSTDKVGKRHMLNAIAAVLHFTEDEKQLVNDTI